MVTIMTLLAIGTMGISGVSGEVKKVPNIPLSGAIIPPPQGYTGGGDRNLHSPVIMTPEGTAGITTDYFNNDGGRVPRFIDKESVTYIPPFSSPGYVAMHRQFGADVTSATMKADHMVDIQAARYYYAYTDDAEKWVEDIEMGRTDDVAQRSMHPYHYLVRPSPLHDSYHVFDIIVLNWAESFEKETNWSWEEISAFCYFFMSAVQTPYFVPSPNMVCSVWMIVGCTTSIYSFHVHDMLTHVFTMKTNNRRRNC